MPPSAEESTKISTDLQIQALKDQLELDKKGLRRISCSLKVWSFLVFIAVVFSSIHTLKVLGPRHSVIALIVGKLFVVGLFFKHVCLAKRAMRNGKANVVSKLHCKAVKTSVFLIIVAVALAVFVVPRVGR
jgi:hypothetical protein